MLGAGLTFGGEALTLLPDRAVWWPARRRLLVADCHFGKAGSFRTAGVAVPEGDTRADILRLEALVAALGAEELMVAGDFFHAPTGLTPAVMAALGGWRERHPALRWHLVVGNHDRALERVPAAWRLEITRGRWREGGLDIVHDPDEADPARASLCGHWHPGLVLRPGLRRPGVRAPIFWLHGQRLILPGFGTFTGSAARQPMAGDRVWAVVGGQLLEVPEAMFANA